MREKGGKSFFCYLPLALVPPRFAVSGRLVKHARYYWLLLAEGHLNRKLFGQMLGRLAALPVPGG